MTLRRSINCLGIAAGESQSSRRGVEFERKLSAVINLDNSGRFLRKARDTGDERRALMNECATNASIGIRVAESSNRGFLSEKSRARRIRWHLSRPI